MQIMNSHYEAVLYQILKELIDLEFDKKQFVTIQYSEVWSRIINIID